MATYVFSDVHGHLAALRRLLDRVQPGEGDRLFCLGDMVDRGPDPVGVMLLVRSLPHTSVLRGNHEDMMLDALRHPRRRDSVRAWEMNGARTTQEGLARLGGTDAEDLVAWAGELPLWASVTVAGRTYLLVHAGIVPGLAPAPRPDDGPAMVRFMAAQGGEAPMWVRDEFWGAPTGLVGQDGAGIVTVAGHTPTRYLSGCPGLDRDPVGPDGLCRMVRAGATSATGGVADKWAIDCGAAGGAGFGGVGMLRLDDGAELFEPVREGE